jgi:hypothetical protein
VSERTINVHIYPFNETGLPVAVIKSVNSDEKYTSLRSWHFPMFWRDMKDSYLFVDEMGEDIIMEDTRAPDQVHVRVVE